MQEAKHDLVTYFRDLSVDLVNGIAVMTFSKSHVLG